MTKQTALRKINNRLWALGTVYHATLPLLEISQAFEGLPFEPRDEGGIYCGRDGQDTVVLHDKATGAEIKQALQFSWHRMPSGRYEVTAYVA